MIFANQYLQSIFCKLKVNYGRSSNKNSDQFIDTAAFLTGAIEYIKTVEGLIPLEELKSPDQWTEQENFLQSFFNLIQFF